jgi:hypothetical protein
VGFLFKTLFFLSLVFLVVMRDAERRPAPREGAAAARLSAAAPAKPRAAAETSSSPIAAARDALADLAEEAAGKIAAVARDHCMAHPLDCVQAAEKISRATAVEPPRRPAGLGAAP